MKTPGAINRQVKQEASIEEMSRLAVRQHMEKFDNWFENLSDSEKNKLIARYIPPQKSVDQELEATALSLDAALTGLPNQTDQSREVYALRKELDRLRIELRKEKELNKAIASKDILDGVQDACNAYSKSIRKYYSGKDDTFMTDDELRKMVRKQFGKGV